MSATFYFPVLVRLCSNGKGIPSSQTGKLLEKYEARKRNLDGLRNLPTHKTLSWCFILATISLTVHSNVFLSMLEDLGVSWVLGSLVETCTFLSCYNWSSERMPLTMITVQQVWIRIRQA